MLAVALRRPDTPSRMRGTAPDDATGDETLMLAYGSGDVRAFERLYARHKGPTYRYFLRHTGDRAVAEELHQDLWLRIVRTRTSYRADARFATWLYTLARNRLVDHWRRRDGALFEPFDESAEGEPEPGAATGADESLDPMLSASSAETGARLVAALAGIPAPQRDAFLLHVEAGLTLAEIASLAGVSAETVKTRLRYAYRRLRAALEDLQ
jgi:RNA polymerase sigma-70 factor (ECF subfamily)